MRIRSTKPEFWRSERVATVEWEVRHVLKALESYVDDNGVGKDDIALIVADCFPRDLTREPSRTLARVSDALEALREAGLLWRYEPDGTPLLYVSFWETIQRIDRPSKGRFPRPDGTLNYSDSEIREPDAKPRDDSRALARVLDQNRGTEEQGNRGTDTRRSAPSDPDGFDDFWEAYPRKVDKGGARAAYKAALKKTTSETLATAAQSYAEHTAKANTEPRFIAHPKTWLNGERWNDRPTPTGRPGTRELPTYAQIGHPDYDPNLAAIVARS